MTLYEIGAEYLKLMEMAEDPDIDFEVIRDTMESIDADLEEKCDGYAAVISEMNGDSAKIDAEIKRLQERKKHIDNNVKNMKQRIMEVLIIAGKKKLTTAMHTFSVRNNGGKQPIVYGEYDLEKLDDRFVKTEKKLDGDAVRAALESGESINFAAFGERGMNLSIR